MFNFGNVKRERKMHSMIWKKKNEKGYRDSDSMIIHDYNKFIKGVNIG